MHVFICENTPNGILTGVYDAWELRFRKDAPTLIFIWYPVSRIITSCFATTTPSHHPLKKPEKLFPR